MNSLAAHREFPGGVIRAEVFDRVLRGTIKQ